MMGIRRNRANTGIKGRIMMKLMKDKIGKKEKEWERGNDKKTG